MPRLSFLVTALLLVLAPAAIAPAAAGTCVAVFDFELLDTSLEGEINGPKSAEQQRLVALTDQLRRWLSTGAGLPVCDMSAVAAEAKASNLSACGCIPRLAGQAGARLAIVGAVHKVSNLILNIHLKVFKVESDTLVIEVNSDIRSNTDNSWARGLDWLIQHRLSGALSAIGEPNQ